MYSKSVFLVMIVSLLCILGSSTRGIYCIAKKVCSQKTLFIKFLRVFNFVKTEHAQSEIHVVEKFWWN